MSMKISKVAASKYLYSTIQRFKNTILRCMPNYLSYEYLYSSCCQCGNTTTPDSNGCNVLHPECRLPLMAAPADLIFTTPSDHQITLLYICSIFGAGVKDFAF